MKKLYFSTAAAVMAINMAGVTSDTCAWGNTTFELDPLTVVGGGGYGSPFHDPFYQPWDHRDEWDNYDTSGGSGGDDDEPEDANCISSTQSQGPLTLSQTDSVNNRNAAYLNTVSGIAGIFVGVATTGLSGPYTGGIAGVVTVTATQALLNVPTVHCGDVITTSITVCLDPNVDNFHDIHSVDTSISHTHFACFDDLGEPPPPCTGCNPQAPVIPEEFVLNASVFDPAFNAASAQMRDALRQLGNEPIKYPIVIDLESGSK